MYVAVAEVGASPLEPYNGDTALEQIQSTVAMTVLCVSDPYSVLGIMRAYWTRHASPSYVNC